MIDESQMVLARDWSGESLTGFLATEKLNGCRVEWDGEFFWTRHGNRVDAPKWFKRGLPRCRLNGEIHAGRGVGFGNNNSAFKVASNAVRLGGNWFNEMNGDHPLLFTVLYVPEVSGNWQRRQRAAARAVRGCKSANAIRGTVLRERGDLIRFMRPLRAVNAEGGMFLRPDGDGSCGRTGELLRLKFVE